jgi:hypothetical protein
VTDSIFIKGGFDLEFLDKAMKHMGRAPDMTNGSHGEDGCGMGKSGVGFNDGAGESPEGVPMDGREGISGRAFKS